MKTKTKKPKRYSFVVNITQNGGHYSKYLRHTIISALREFDGEMVVTVRPLPQPKKPVSDVLLDREWKKGYACAVATLIRSHGVGTEVDDLIRAGLRDLKHVDLYDCEVLRPEMKRLKEKMERFKEAVQLAKARKEAAK